VFDCLTELLIIIMDKDSLRQLGQEVEFKDLMYNLFTLRARKCYIFYAVCRALWMVLQFNVAVGCYYFIQRRTSDPESHD
jgi:hypothetical protein